MTAAHPDDEREQTLHDRFQRCREPRHDSHQDGEPPCDVGPPRNILRNRLLRENEVVSCQADRAHHRETQSKAQTPDPDRTQAWDH